MEKKESGSRNWDKRTKLYPLAVFLCFFLVFMSCDGNRVMAANGKEQEPGSLEGSIREKALETQVREYFDAVSERDARRTKMLTGTESPQREKWEETLWSAGVEAINVIDLIIYPCEEYRIVIVSYEIEIEGIKTKAPGANTFIAKEADEGGFILLFSEDMEQEIPENDREILVQNTKKITENQDIIEFFEKINQEYAAAKEDPELREWEEKWLAEQSREQRTADPSMPYVVKEGDCLWNIAGSMLGDGAKWDTIYEKNKGVIGGNPDYIMPGMELQLP